jgi:4-hydroxyacetophenone monooxygenase
MMDTATRRAAIAAAEVHPLLCAVAHVTGDLTLLRSDLAPDQQQMLVPGRGLTGEQEEEARALCLAALEAHGSSGRPDHTLTAEERQQVFAFLVGEGSTAQWSDFLIEELSLGGTDPRAPSWTMAEFPRAAPRRCAAP